MSLNFTLNRIYFKSYLFIIFGVVQLLMNLSLVAYLMWDFVHHFKQSSVIGLEVLILLFMVVDVLIYTLIHGIHFNLINFLEWVTMLNFFICFSFMAINGVQAESEEFEIYLMMARFFLQLIRLVIGVARVRENTSKKQSAQNIEINIDTLNMQEDNTEFFGIELMHI